MKLFLLRHGMFVKQNPLVVPLNDIPLTPEALTQIQTVAKHLKDAKIEAIITSPVERALKTATTISKKLNIPLEKNSLFAERKQPSELYGQPINNVKVQEAFALMDSNYGDKNFRYSDEETFLDLKKRSGKALDYVLNQPQQRLCVVSHSEFMAMFIAQMLFGKSLTAQEFIKVRAFLFVGLNTLHICEYKNKNWRLIQWNRYLDEFLEI